MANDYTMNSERFSSSHPASLVKQRIQREYPQAFDVHPSFDAIGGGGYISYKLPKITEGSNMEAEIKKLQESLSVDCWGQHPRYDREYWRNDVQNGYTQLGYWEAVIHFLESNATEEEP